MLGLGFREFRVSGLRDDVQRDPRTKNEEEGYLFRWFALCGLRVLATKALPRLAE